MEDNKSLICPWCQTEIVWDPELGPEEQCPHCLNELKGYRTLKIDMDLNEDELFNEEERATGLDFEDDLDSDDLEVDDLLDDYEGEHRISPVMRRMLACMDGQEHAPECTNCHELMLHAGVRTVESTQFKPTTPAALGTAFLTGPYQMDVYVCPSCFKVDEYVSKDDQAKLLKAFEPEELN